MKCAISSFPKVATYDNTTTPLRIVLPGGSGQVGNILSRYFHAQGHDVVVLARSATPAQWHVVNWDGANLGNWTSVLENADVLINLSGRSVGFGFASPCKDHRNQRTGLPPITVNFTDKTALHFTIYAHVEFGPELVNWVTGDGTSMKEYQIVREIRR